MFKFRKANQELNNQANYAPGKKYMPKLQWYIIVAVLCLPIVLIILYIMYSHYYPHAKGVITTEEFVLNAPEAGFVKQVFVAQGRLVVKGDSLVLLSSPVLESEIALLEQQIKELKTEENSFKNYELATLEKSLDLAAIDMQSNQSYYEKLLSYQSRGMVTLLQLNQAKSEYLQSQNSYRNILAQISQSKIDFSVKKTEVFGDDIRKLEQEINQKMSQKSLLLIKAPTSAAVKEIAASNGEYIDQDKEVIVLASLDNFRIVAFIDSKYLKSAKLGSSVRIIMPNKTIVNGVIENIPKFTDRLYKGIDLVSEEGEKKVVLVIKPSDDFPEEYKISGIQVEVLL